MSNKDTVLTKMHHENSAKSVHEDAKKSLADHGSYDPTVRLMAEMKANAKHPGLDGGQAPPRSIIVPEVKSVEVKPGTLGDKDSVQEAQTKRLPETQHEVLKTKAHP